MPESHARLAARLARVDWAQIGETLDERGHATLPGLLSAAECRAAAARWNDEAAFRKHVDMGRLRFGEGSYRYFARPLPPDVEALRSRLYPPLAIVANRWMERLGETARYPRTLKAYLALCHQAGQTRPTPLLLRYAAGGYNNLHQDRYGALAFPLQVAVLLTDPARFTGGEFLLVEQRPRQQSRGEAITLRRGEAVIFPNAVRPIEGSRGWYRGGVRHGVSRLHRGERMTLGIIFHDAE